METGNQMVQDHGYALSDINSMMPFEYEITVLMIQKNLETKAKLRGNQ